MNKKKAIIFKNFNYKEKFDQFIKKDLKISQKYQSFLISEFNTNDIYKIGLKLRQQDFSFFILFESFELGFDYFKINKHNIIKIDCIDINIYFIVKNKNKLNYFFSDLGKLPIIYKDLIEKNNNFKKITKLTEDSILVDRNIYKKESFIFVFEKIKILERSKNLSRLKKQIFDNYGFYNLSNRQFIKINLNYFEKFLQKVNNNFFDGKDNNVKIKLIKKTEDDQKEYYNFIHNYGRFLIVKFKKDNSFFFEVNFYSQKAIDVLRSDSILKGIIVKYSNPPSRKKMSKRNLFFIFLSFLILAVTLWFTFGVLYQDSYNNIFKILGSGVTTASFYILIFNFFVSLFFSMILMTIFNYIENKKFNFKNVLLWFFAAQIRFFVLGLTGNHILSIFFYSLYINKVIRISKPRIGGIIGAGFIFRGIVHFFSGSIFMLIGFIYLFTYDLNSFDMQLYFYVVMSLSLGGLFLATGFSILSGLVIVNEKFHNFYSIFYLKFKMLNKKNDYFNIFNSFEEKSYELKISSKKWLKNKKLLMRISLVIFCFFLFEAIETIAAYDITVNYVNKEFIPSHWEEWVNKYPVLENFSQQDLYLDIQYNFIEFAGLRSIVKNANDFFPFIPFGYVEYIVNGLYNIILWQNVYQIVEPIADFSNIPIDNIINDQRTKDFVNVFSTSTTFITMFFGKYMRLIFSFIIFSYFILYEFIWKNLKQKYS